MSMIVGPIVQQFLHPPINTLQEVAVASVSAGSTLLTPAQMGFGHRLVLTTIPAGFGFEVGEIATYYDLLAQIVCYATSLGGTEVVLDAYNGRLRDWAVIYDHPTIYSAIHLYIAPGCAGTLYAYKIP